MEKRRFVYYEDDGFFVGYFEEYPDYRTQGKSLDELRENLRDILAELESGRVPCVHRVGELLVG